MSTNDQATCACPWAHCAQRCFTSCDHNDPCLHHGETPRRSEFFIDLDAESEPTLWLESGEYPRALIRRCDIPFAGRWFVWSLLQRAIA